MQVLWQLLTQYFDQGASEQHLRRSRSCRRESCLLRTDFRSREARQTAHTQADQTTFGMLLSFRLNEVNRNLLGFVYKHFRLKLPRKLHTNLLQRFFEGVLKNSKSCSVYLEIPSKHFNTGFTIIIFFAVIYQIFSEPDFYFLAILDEFRVGKIVEDKKR